MENNVVLIGMMGSGKTSVARYLSSIINYNIYDTDEMIENMTNLKIKDIFELHSEEYFRELESNILIELSLKSNSIISCGGGIILKEKNRELLRELNTVYLETSIDVLIIRLQNERDNRPLISSKDFETKLEEIYYYRKNLYLQCSSINVNTDNKNIEQVTKEISLRLGL
jgi:shikimate kinase